MATLKIRIENGRFTETVGEARYFEGFSEDGLHATGNGWEVEIRPAKGRKAGKIICHAERQYSDGPAICHREFKLADGVLGLAGGNIHDRYTYFRTNEFSQFLHKIGVESVSKIDPNGSYCIGGDGKISIKTDGKVHRDWEQVHWSDYKVVSGATWAIIDKYYNNGFNWVHSRILYTLEKNVMALEIPAAN